MRSALLVLVGAVTITSCSGEESPDNPGGKGGRAGSGGSAGTGGAAGTSGTSGSGGSAGQPDGGDGSVEPTCQTPCASGRCEADGDCQHCISDSECQTGRVCSSGTCLPGCSGDSCPSGFSCCSGRCADLTRDFGNCRACGTACSGESFCGSAGCQQAVVSAVCQVPRVTLVLGGGEVDDAETALFSAALASKCTTPPALRTVTEAEATFLHPTTARPVLGSGELVVVIGGTAFQQLVKYLEDSALTRVYNYYDPTEVRFHGRGADGGAQLLVQAAQSEITNTHSYFLIESVVDPTSRTWVMEVYGLSSAGTRAGSWYFRNQVLPPADPGTFAKRYYVYEWQSATATSNDPVEPGASDTFRLVSSGP
ncbi:MAG TPA: hypothetical protein VI072_27465 [Polyangiaceae bacterium]